MRTTPPIIYFIATPCTLALKPWVTVGGCCCPLQTLSLPCSPWSQDKLLSLWGGRLPQEEKHKKRKIRKYLRKQICMKLLPSVSLDAMRSSAVLSLFRLSVWLSSRSRSWWGWRERPVGTDIHGTPAGGFWLRLRFCSLSVHGSLSYRFITKISNPPRKHNCQLSCYLWISVPLASSARHAARHTLTVLWPRTAL